jgi:hypothetical protein
MMALMKLVFVKIVFVKRWFREDGVDAVSAGRDATVSRDG